MAIIDFKSGVLKAKKTIRQSGIEAYQKGYDDAIKNQANAAYMRTVVERIQREVFRNYGQLLNYFESKGF